MQQTELSYFFVEEKSFLALRPLFEIGALAQSVEQRTENPCVAGSIPAGTTTKKKEALEYTKYSGVFSFIDCNHTETFC